MSTRERSCWGANTPSPPSEPTWEPRDAPGWAGLLGMQSKVEASREQIWKDRQRTAGVVRITSVPPSNVVCLSPSLGGVCFVIECVCTCVVCVCVCGRPDG